MSLTNCLINQIEDLCRRFLIEVMSRLNAKESVLNINKSNNLHWIIVFLVVTLLGESCAPLPAPQYYIHG